MSSSEQNPVYVRDLKTFIEAVEFIADVEAKDWVPSARQWNKIREMINNLQESESNQKRSFDNQGFPVPNHIPPMPNVLPPRLGPSGMSSVNASPPPPPMTGSFANGSSTIKTPDGDNKEGYHSNFV